MEMALVFLVLCLGVAGVWGGGDDGKGLFRPSKLEMFVDELPQMPRLQGYEVRNGVPFAGNLTIGMYEETWPAMETPREGGSEVWHVIKLTALFVVLEQRELADLDAFKNRMRRLNEAIKCRVGDHASRRRHSVPRYESGWKNVFKMRPGFVLRILVRFKPLGPETKFPFNATAEPGYVYHCHILDHGDKEMMRPSKLRP